MRRAVSAIAVLSAVAALGVAVGTGCGHKEPAGPAQPGTPQAGAQTAQDGRTKVEVSRPQVANNEIGLKPEKATITPGGDPVAKTLDALLAQPPGDKGVRAVPEGTKLLGVTVKDGVATVNLSKEFGELNQHGATAASLAQNALRGALAQFDDVKSMTVLVEGKPFEDDHGGAWDNIPVRDEHASNPTAPFVAGSKQ